MFAGSFDNGIDFILFLQGLGDWLAGPMRLVSFLGQEEFFLLFMPALYWCIDAALGLRIGLLLMIADGLNAVLKLAFHTPRPFWYSRQPRALAYESSFGVPSGHAQDAAAVWGCLAASLRRGWAWALFGLVIFAIGFSRAYLAVHFAIDVLLGWAFGFLVLLAFLVLEKPVLAWLARRGAVARQLAALALSLALLLAGALTRAALGIWPLPSEWVENALASFPAESPINPLSLSGLVTSTGALLGLSSGALWLWERGGFEVGGSWRRRALRYPIGVLGTVILWYGLGAVFPRGDFLLAYGLRFARYFLVGFWVIALAPLAFIRLGLASAGKALPAVEQKTRLSGLVR